MEYQHQIIINGHKPPSADDKQFSALLTKHLSKVSVHRGLEAPVKFSATFHVDICDDEGLTLISDPRLRPGTSDTFAIVTQIDAVYYCLVHGKITAAEAQLKRGGAGSTLQLSGEDLTLLLASQRANVKHTGLLSDLVTPWLKDTFKTEPVVTPTILPHADKKLLSSDGDNQRDFIKNHGAKEGHYFWLQSEINQDFLEAHGGAPIRNTAYFKPLIQLPHAPKPDDKPATASLVPPSPIEFVINPSAGEAACAHPNRVVISDLQVGYGKPPSGYSDYVILNDKTGTISLKEVDFKREADTLMRLFVVSDTYLVPVKGGGRAVGTPPPEEEGGPDFDKLARTYWLTDIEPALRASLSDAMWTLSLQLQVTSDTLLRLLSPHERVHLRGAGVYLDGRAYLVREVVHTLTEAGHSMAITLMGIGLPAQTNPSKQIS